jgi:hypothetical protein
MEAREDEHAAQASAGTCFRGVLTFLGFQDVLLTNPADGNTVLVSKTMDGCF